MIYTSYFAKVKDLPKSIVPIAICGKSPDWWDGLEYKHWLRNGSSSSFGNTRIETMNITSSTIITKCYVAYGLTEL